MISRAYYGRITLFAAHYLLNRSLGVGLAPAATSIASANLGAARSTNIIPQPGPTGCEKHYGETLFTDGYFP